MDTYPQKPIRGLIHEICDAKTKVGLAKLDDNIKNELTQVLEKLLKVFEGHNTCVSRKQ
jgi:hypothetical protein